MDCRYLHFSFFMFQIAFMGTAATIVSGAVAERIKFHSYMLMSVIISVLIYPVFGHWVWGGGWLAELGFIDFAGSTVVHSVGGWIGLAGAIVLGPRKDKYSENGELNHMYEHNLPLSVLGTLILWLGWFGFNGGSTLGLTDQMPRIIVNTTLAEAVDSFQTIRNEIDILKRIMKMLLAESDNYRSIVHEMRTFFTGINSKIDMITSMVHDRQNDITEVLGALWGINHAFEELQTHSASVQERSRDLFTSSEQMKQSVESFRISNN
jgi:hypothetical protein